MLIDIFKFLFIQSDEDRLFNGSQPDPIWEQFAVVAADLLERIQSSLSYNNTPYDTSDDEEDNGSPIIVSPSITNGKMKNWLQNS